MPDKDIMMIAFTKIIKLVQMIRLGQTNTRKAWKSRRPKIQHSLSGKKSRLRMTGKPYFILRHLVSRHWRHLTEVNRPEHNTDL